ncbi:MULTISPECIES: DUF2946 family protein [Filomicrobium]|uniref:DUF2946 family protein n=1 Tax=Filomicrobium TaxID=119044 RepID=UPI0006250208|nr:MULTISPECIES: DUF2946 family protein [Filomicrobium]MCV0369674.1 DUF2946 family protein [Filomicrobium sp.]
MRRRTTVNVILLLVLAVRSLLPAGFMLEASNASAGSFEIVICTSTGAKLLTVDADGKPSKTEPQHDGKGLCPFAASGAAALVSAEPQSLVHEAEYAAVTYTTAVALFAVRPKPGAASARGPPSSALI